jgi:hypothetical protein
MTALQEAPVTTPAETESPAVPGYKSWCPQCYVTGIDRLINGFTIQHNQPGFPARIVPPADPGTARSLANARDAILTQRADWPSDARSHPRHAGARS